MTGFGAWGMPGGGFNWNMLTGLGAGMLANAEYSPGQAFGKGYNQAMQGGLDMAKQQLLFQEYDQRRRQQQQMEQLRKELLPMLTGQGQQPPPTAGATLGAGAPAGGGFSQEFPNTAGALGMEAAPQQPMQQQAQPAFDAQRYQQLAQAAAKAEMYGQQDIADGLKVEMQRMQTMYDQGIKGDERRIAQSNLTNDTTRLMLDRQRTNWQTGGEEAEKRYRGLVDSGMKARSRKGTLDLMDRALSDDKVYTGEGGDIVLRLRRLGAAAGINGSEGIANTEQFNALAKQDVLNRIGGSLGAQISNSDRMFIEQTGPALGNTKEGNKQLIDISKKLTEREVKISDMARQYKKENGQLDEGFDDLVAQYAEANPLFPTTPTSGVQGGGSTTPNPSNAPVRKKWLGPGQGMQVVP